MAEWEDLGETEDYLYVGDPPESVQGGEWHWFEGASLEVESSAISPEVLQTLFGDMPPEQPTGPVRISVPDESGRQINFIMYKVQFEPFKFDYWNKWYKKPTKKLFGPRFAYWLFYRNALKVSYSGKALVSGE